MSTVQETSHHKENTKSVTMLFYPTYFSSIAQYVAIAKADEILFEVADNFQKQTYRTRCYIYGANGKQLLNIPVLRANSKQATKDIQIDYSEAWQKQHLKAIESAYNSSPFYEFFDIELAELFSRKEKFLLDFNLQCFEFIADAIQLENSIYKTTESYTKDHTEDYRYLVNAKSKQVFTFDKYYQVFNEKHGFIENLSILDLLFMEGSNTLLYLENQSL